MRAMIPRDLKASRFNFDAVFRSKRCWAEVSAAIRKDSYPIVCSEDDRGTPLEWASKCWLLEIKID